MLAQEVNTRRLIGPFSQVISMEHLPLHGPLHDGQLTIVEHGGVLVNAGHITDVGEFNFLKQKHPEVVLEIIDGPAVLLPGFIDCHTHICYAGSRAQDYALKLQGKSYLEIARMGGGIRRSVEFTRQATEAELTQSMVVRVNRHVSEGVTTIEVKSGYGLSVEAEMKMLRAIKEASRQTQASIIPTCLAAHTIPAEFDGSSSMYLSMVLNDLLPKVRQEDLANRVDIFVEDTAFSLEEAEWYLKITKELGFQATVHADQFTPGGAKLAVKLGALSADHLEASGEEDIHCLAKSDTVAVVLPGASLGLGIPFAPARKLLDAGCCLAIASDWNPGSAPMGDLLLQAALISLYQKLSFTETIAGLTFRAAKALGLTDRGRLVPGMLAHMIAFATNDYRDILYYQGKLKPSRVWTA